MATFDKAHKAFRRSHKERHQLGHRARLGLLEKHKDYVLRAKDYARYIYIYVCMYVYVHVYMYIYYVCIKC